MFEQSGRLFGAEAAGEQLVDEGGLVAGASAGVEQRAVRVGQRAQPFGGQAQRLLPRDRHVVGGAGREVHGLGEAAQRLELVVVEDAQLLDRVPGEERGVDAAPRGLPGDRLGAVLAELGGLAVVRVGVGPGAARAVEAVRLIHLQKRAQAALRAHLLKRVLHRMGDAGQPDRGVLRLLDAQAVGRGRLFGLGHGAHPSRLGSPSTLLRTDRSVRPHRR
jgi:hypothetical protein